MERLPISLPTQTWRILGLTAVLLLLTTVVAIAIISAGFFDPKPVGELTAEIPLQPLSAAANIETIEWLDAGVTGESFSLRLTAAHQSGELDSGYGIVLGSKESALVAAVSPTGYVTVIDKGTPLMQWQTWPHVNTGQETNEIWLDKRGDTITIRVNRELLWTGNVPIAGTQVGLWTASYGETVTIAFQKLSISLSP